LVTFVRGAKRLIRRAASPAPLAHLSSCVPSDPLGRWRWLLLALAEHATKGLAID